MRPLNCGCVFAAVLAVFLSPTSAMGQMRHKPVAADAHQHIFAIVPMIGAGTMNDPKRPMFTLAQGVKPVLPIASHSTAISAPRTGIIGFHAQISDDGKSALVEFIAPSVSDFKDLLNANDSRVRTFQPGVHGKDLIEAACKTQKKDFSFDKFRTKGVR